MSECKYCGRNIAAGFSVCPMCSPLKNERSDVAAACYPRYKKTRRPGSLRVRLTWALVLLTAASVIVNICVGGRAWSIYVVLGAYINYRTFLHRTLVEAGNIRKFLSVIVSVCLLLIMIEVISGHDIDAVQFLIPILLYAALIVAAVVYFVGFRSQKGHLIPLIIVIGLSLVCMTFSILMYRTMRWSTVLMVSVAAGIILLGGLFFRKSILNELKKKIHR